MHLDLVIFCFHSLLSASCIPKGGAHLWLCGHVISGSTHPGVPGLQVRVCACMYVSLCASLCSNTSDSHSCVLFLSINLSIHLSLSTSFPSLSLSSTLFLFPPLLPSPPPTFSSLSPLLLCLKMNQRRQSKILMLRLKTDYPDNMADQIN